MAKKVHDLIRRTRALDGVRARYEGKPFAFRTADCLSIARYHLVRMGHRKLPKLPSYSTLLGAKKALASQGVKSLAELLDKHLERIVPAEMLMGDLAVVPGTDEEGGESILISTGQKLWGFHEDAGGYTLIDPAVGAVTKAWRA